MSDEAAVTTQPQMPEADGLYKGQTAAWWAGQQQQLKAELDTVNPAKDALEAQLVKVKADLAAMVAENGKVNLRLAEVSAQLVSTINQRNDLQGRLDASDHALQGSQKAAIDAQAFIANQADLLKAFRATLPKVAAACAELHSQLTPLIGK